MGWTKKWKGDFLELSSGSGDFVWGTEFPERPEGIRVESIQVVFNAANDRAIIRHGSLTGPSVFDYTTLDGSSVAKRFYGALMKPYIETDDLTGTYGNWKIIIQTV